MNHASIVKSRRWGRGPRRRGRTRGALLILSQIAILVHFLIAAHAVPHVSHAFAEADAHHCAVCAAGQMMEDVPTLTIAAAPLVVVWMLELVKLWPGSRILDRATCVRAPPSVIPTITIG